MNKLQILLVEDDRFFQTIIGQIAENNGFEMQIADNGKAAIDKLHNSAFDIILMDVQMPEMDGYAATEYIRKNVPQAQNIPIIIITAQDQPRQDTKSLLIGANSYLKKPFSEDELLAEIQTLLVA